MKAKIRKLRRDPLLFLKDSKLNTLFFTSKDKRELDNKTTKKATHTDKLQKKREPLLFGKVLYEDELFSLELYKKDVINQRLGFSSLILTEDNSELLIKQPYLSLILKDKSFIAFKDKSVYFLREDKQLQGISFSKKKINEIFLTNETMRQNKFSQFRNIISINPLTPTSIMLRQTNPKLRTIYIFDNEKSLEYMSQYLEFIDVIIAKKDLDLQSFKNVPRIVHFDDDSFMNVLKLILVDNSYKKDDNVLLPILTTQDNISNIDYFNKNNVDGLIRIESNVKNIKTFDDLITKSKILEFYLKENIYSLYKDAIFAIKTQDDLKKLLKLTLKDGVHFEEI